MDLLVDNCSTDSLCPGVNCSTLYNVDDYGRHYIYGSFLETVNNTPWTDLYNACNCSSFESNTYHVSENHKIQYIAHIMDLD